MEEWAGQIPQYLAARAQTSQQDGAQNQSHPVLGSSSSGMGTQTGYQNYQAQSSSATAYQQNPMNPTGGYLRPAATAQQTYTSDMINSPTGTYGYAQSNAYAAGGYVASQQGAGMQQYQSAVSQGYGGARVQQVDPNVSYAQYDTYVQPAGMQCLNYFGACGIQDQELCIGCSEGYHCGHCEGAPKFP